MCYTNMTPAKNTILKNKSNYYLDDLSLDEILFPILKNQPATEETYMMNCLVLHLFHSYQCWYTMIKKKIWQIISSCPFMQFFVKMIPWMYYTLIMTFFYCLILGLDILDSFYCLGSKFGNFIQDMKLAVWSNSAKWP